MSALLLLRACSRPRIASTYNCTYPGLSTVNSTYNHRLASTDAAAAAASVQLANAGGLVGFWQTLSNSTPVAYMQDVLIKIHDYSGLPWWASIVLSTFLFRSVVTLPLTIYQHKITAKIEKIALEMPAIVEELKKEAAMAKQKFKWSDKQTQIVYRRSVCSKKPAFRSSPNPHFLLDKEAMAEPDSPGQLSSHEDHDCALGSDSPVDLPISGSAQLGLHASGSHVH